MRFASLAFAAFLVGCSEDPIPDTATTDTGSTDVASDLGTETAAESGATDTGIPADTGATDTSAGDTGVADTADAGATFTLTSTAFADGAAIPIKFTCDGADVSPALAWTSAPAGTKSFVLVVDDPDAPSGTFVHWVLFDLSGATAALTEGSTAGVAGKNGFGATRWNGPCPPPGKVHHYQFQLRALDVATLGTSAGASRAAVDAAVTGHVLGTAKVVGTYTR